MTRPHRPIPARLTRLNPTAVFLGALAYVLVALFAPGLVGGAMLLALVVALVALLALTWPAHPARVRGGRLVIIGLLFVAALVKVL